MEEGGGFKSLSKISVESFSQQSKQQRIIWPERGYYTKWMVLRGLVAF